MPATLFYLGAFLLTCFSGYGYAVDLKTLFISPGVDNTSTAIRVVERDDAGKNALRAHCRQRRSFWIWPDIGPLKCAKISEPNTIDTLVMSFTPSLAKELPTGYAIVSTLPFKKQRWSLSNADASQLKVAQKMSRLSGKQRLLLANPGNVRSLTISNNPNLVFLVFPYRFVKLRPQLPEGEEGDGRVSYIQYRIVREVNGKWEVVYESENFPEFFGDLNGDGVPEIKQSPYCDGNCVYFDSFYPVLETVLEHDVHG